MNQYIKLAIARANKTFKKNEGGPFGAAIVDKDGKLLAVASNQVLRKKDPTAHAEVEAIRKACKKINSHDLTGCTIYSTCEPCPMCLSAIIWANIKTVYFGADKKDAASIGFRDDYIYDYLENKSKDVLDIKIVDKEECLKLFTEYKNMNKEIY